MMVFEPGTKLPNEASPDMVNCQVFEGTLRKRFGYTQFPAGAASIGGVVMGLYSTQDDESNTHLIATYPAGAAKLVAGVWAAMTGPALTGSSLAFFQFETSQNAIVFSQGVDQVMKHDISTANTVYAILNANCPAARYLTRFADRLFIAHTVEGGATKPFRIRRSVAADHTDWVGIGSGFVQFPVALAASATYALVIGALSLRTRGVYFIMITLAFAQMAYYVASGLARYGGDDGLTVYKRSDFAGLINLSNRVQFYYLCLACLLAVIFLIWRIINSRFGLVVQGLRSNEQRMQAIGFPAKRYKLVCFVIAGTMCGLAGALLANNTDFISPAVMYWTRSGDLMVMVILGGMGTLFGPVIGAVAYLVLEEMLSRVTEYWAMIMGPLLLLIVLFGRGGIMGLLGRFERV